MRGLTVTFDTVTPLFLGGADPRGEPEIRVPSFRGALRYWLRALLGGVVGDATGLLGELHQAESMVFGSTDMGASPVVMRTRHDSLTLTSFSKLANGKPGIAYLFFAARHTKQEPERCAILADGSIELTLSIRPGVDKTDNRAYQQAYASLWLLTHLGGLGTRSRRGGGCLQIVNVDRKSGDLPSLSINAITPKELQSELQDGLNRFRQLVYTGIVPTISNPSAFDVLHPCVCKVWVLNRSFGSWDGALDTIGKEMQEFRSRRRPDYDNVKAAVIGGPLTDTIQRSAFGLPIGFHFSSLDREYKRQGCERKEANRKSTGILAGNKHERRASPLAIHVTRLANGQYVLVLTVFKAELLENKEGLELRRNGPTARVKSPSLTLIDQFLKQLDSKVAAILEVEYE